MSFNRRVKSLYSSQNGALLYTYENLSNNDLDILESLPISVVVDIPNCIPIHICHATIESNKVLLKQSTPLQIAISKNLLVNIY